MSSEPEADRPKTTRAPRYKVLELQEAMPIANVRAAMRELATRAGMSDPDAEFAIDSILDATGGRDGWFTIGDNVSAATDRKAITSIIGTPDEPAEGFDADRRLLPHAAVLVGQWHERRLKREVHKPTLEEAAKLKALLDGTVTEEWE